MSKPQSPPEPITYRLNLNEEDTTDTLKTLKYYQKIIAVPANALIDRKGRYLHWDEIRMRPLPNGVDDHQVWWHALKAKRGGAYKTLSLKSISDGEFKFLVTERMQAQLHRIDQQLSGHIGAPEITNKHTGDRYIINSHIDEAITSSQLEGASTSHRVAKSMLRENREPTNRSERMIVNNYEVMRFIRDTAKHIELNEALLLELHRIVTKRTLASSDTEGHFKTDDRTNVLLHQPPLVKELPPRMKALYLFANEQNDATHFTHPVVRAVILHFMIAYIHPFADGNGRTARALFYWLMARHGYFMMEYISISTINKQASAQYRTAYLYVETDDDVLTYFIDYHLRVIAKAIERLESYLKDKAEETATIQDALQDTKWQDTLNHRQIALLSSAIKSTNETYTVTSHAKSHNVALQTARNDLAKLAAMGLLVKRTIGKTAMFRPAPNLNDLLKMNCEFNGSSQHYAKQIIFQ